MASAAPSPNADRLPALIWRIHPLPDFLADHTLTGEQASHKLQEVVSRWVQWVGSLWNWFDQASFALRFSAKGGRVHIHLLAKPRDPTRLELLRSELAVLLRAHRLGNGQTLDAAGRAECARDFFLEKLALLEVGQYETRSLWKIPPSLLNNDQFRQQFSWLPAVETREPRVIYPWWAPGGPFLVPMESLISQPVPVTLTIYLEPTQLSTREWNWLGMMAQHAQSQGEQNLQQVGSGAGMRIVDPSANLAGKLYMANLRRLSAMPFQVSVHCAASEGRFDVAQSMAGAVQALLHETPFDGTQKEDERLPSGARVRGFQDAALRTALRQYVDLQFPASTEEDPLSRIPYLADARGAATVFRLPVSVRGGVPGIEVRQLSPDFHPGARTDQRPAGHFSLGKYQAGGGVYVPVNDLCKHALITGFTGSGKTVTVLQLLHQLWVDHHVPFLVLESAKQEYRGLMEVEAFSGVLSVYTLGNELCAPFRLNPFELLPGVRVEAHLSKLQTCFEGAIPPIGPSSSVIAEGLLRVYAEQGWSLTDVYPEAGESKRKFPRLSDFVRVIERVLAERGYEGEVQSNLKAALVGRFKPLLMGGKGRMFDTQTSWPSPDDLFRYPVVLEMNDLSIDDKALVVMFLLTMLREHRERNRSGHGELVHITMVEEAHNVLENVASKGGGEGATSADTRFKAVEAFCQLLTEIRSLGEGLIIADQSPEKLARDAMRNTNLQIAHQLRDGNDREAIANAMIMEKEQCDFLGKLRPGQAALFRTGLEKATFIQVEKYYPNAGDFTPLSGEDESAVRARLKSQFRGIGFNTLLSDASLAAKMLARDPTLSRRRELSLPFQGCTSCQSKCVYRDAMHVEIQTHVSRSEAVEYREKYCDEKGTTPKQLWEWTAQRARAAAARAELPADQVDAGWCYFVHLWDLIFDPKDAKKKLDDDCYSTFSMFYNKTRSRK
jgi:hypothetical protein